ncbi:MAG TPA: hypothetical protein VMR31_15505 [Myxococcota bacterium]|nr:hypothetical protein [Myxococcota bacterium]
MCPVCATAAAATWLLAGSAGAGGLGALALIRRRPNADAEPDFQLRMQPDSHPEPEGDRP